MCWNATGDIKINKVKAFIFQGDKSGWPLGLMFSYLWEPSIEKTELDRVISTEEAEASRASPFLTRELVQPRGFRGK